MIKTSAITTATFATKSSAKSWIDRFFERSPIKGVVIAPVECGDHFEGHAQIDANAPADAKSLLLEAGFIVTRHDVPSFSKKDVAELDASIAEQNAAIEAEVDAANARIAATANDVMSKLQGLADTKAKALAAARAAFVKAGFDDPAAYAVRKTARGEFWWGPANAPEAQPKPGRDAKADAQRAKAATKAAKPVKARAKAAATPEAKSARAAADSDAAKALLRLMQRKKGATFAEIEEACGWRVRRWIRDTAEAAGLKLEVIKDGRIAHYVAA
jgi:hypothetical protein